MRFVCRTCGVVREAQEQPSQHPSEVVCGSCGAAMTPDGAEPRPLAPRSRAVAVGLNEQWFVTTETGGREGPYSAGQVARLLEQGVLGWNSQIWREGLKDWRPARRDDLLVFAVASARGMASDTSRVDMLAEILQDDTFVQDEPPASLPRAPETPAPEPAAMPPPPQPRAEVTATPASPTSTPKRPSWLLRYSTPLIAVLAFASGVLLTQVARRIGGAAAERDTGASRERGDAAASPQLVRTAASIPENREPSAPAARREAARAMRARPEASEIQAELTRLAPSVHRCARRLGALEVEVVIDGETGRSKPAQLRAKGLRGGRLGCVTRALGALQIAPFVEPTFRLAHRYRW